MMKAAYKYYQESKTEPRHAVALSDLNYSNAPRVTFRKRKKQPVKVEFTKEEQALLQLVAAGQLGEMMARSAPVTG